VRQHWLVPSEACEWWWCECVLPWAARYAARYAARDAVRYAARDAALTLRATLRATLRSAPLGSNVPPGTLGLLLGLDVVGVPVLGVPVLGVPDLGVPTGCVGLTPKNLRAHSFYKLIWDPRSIVDRICGSTTVVLA
jgi:hypothetical protein